MPIADYGTWASPISAADLAGTTVGLSGATIDGDHGDWLERPPAQAGRPGSTLELYREALRLRRQLQGAEELEWGESPDPQVLHVVRPGGWHCVTNFGPEPVALPDGVVRVASGPLTDGRLPGETTGWLTEWPQD